MSVRIDVDIDDFMEECDSYDIKEIIDWLVDNDHLSRDGLILIEGNKMSFDETELIQNLKKIRSKYHSLTNEQLDVIKQLSI